MQQHCSDMDWTSIACTLGECAERPLVLLDRGGRIRMFNRAMEQVLGWSRFQVEGQPWHRVCAPPEQEDEVKQWIDQPMCGALRNCEVTALTNRGTRVVFHFEYSLVGRGANQGLLMSATRVVPINCFQGSAAGCDLDYEVSVNPAEFGALVRLCVNGENVPIVDPHEQRCYKLMYEFDRPCDHCPLLKTSETEAKWPRIFVRQRPAHGGATQGSVFEMTVADRASPRVMRVRVRNISETMLDAIHEAKVRQPASRAGLSPREREVLGYLLLGRSIEDISEAIGISARTVKHHQAGMLQKLGADSRVDLMRLIF